LLALSLRSRYKLGFRGKNVEMDEQQLREAIALGHETDRVEFKSPGPLTDEALFLKSFGLLWECLTDVMVDMWLWVLRKPTAIPWILRE